MAERYHFGSWSVRYANTILWVIRGEGFGAKTQLTLTNYLVLILECAQGRVQARGRNR
jgi:hypothetical protein